jgi:protein SCO1/2
MASWWSTALGFEERAPLPRGRGSAGPKGRLRLVHQRAAVLCAALLASALAGCSRRAPLPVYGVVPDFTLIAQTGAPFDSKALEGKVWVADFVFTRCPGPCPRMSSQMHQVETAFTGEPNVRFVSFTVDPARDTPDVLAAYAEHFQADPAKWFFLTGAMPDLNRLSRGAFMLGDIDGSLQHSTRFALVDGKSRIRGYYQTNEPEAIPNLIADVRRLLGERL